MSVLMPVFAALALTCLAGLKPVRSTSFGRSILFGLLGMAVSIATIRSATEHADIGRTTDFDRVVNQAVATVAADPTAPLIVFSGASYSRNALDDRKITGELRSAGYPHHVVNLSLEAASLLEREAHLKAVLDRIDTPPALIFIEVAPAFDLRPAQMFDNSKFSARAIEQFDVRNASWTLLGLAQGGCDGAADCAKSTALTGAHMAVNMANLGLLSQGRNPSEAGELAAYDPQDVPRELILEGVRQAGLSIDAVPTPGHGPQWIASRRAHLANDLRARGVGQIGYYFPPVIAPDARAYAADLCLGEFQHAPCFPPTDTDLLAALDGPVWLDSDHLLARGAEIYSRWLATELAASGLLGAPRISPSTLESAAP